MPTIDQYTALNSADITDRTDIHFVIADTQGTPATKKILLSELDNLWAADIAQPRIYSASHGLSGGSAGLPIGWKADGKPYVWNDAALTEEPVAILISVPDSNHIVAATFGEIVEIATSLLPGSMPVYGSNTNSRRLFYDTSAGTYKHVVQADTKVDAKLIYYIGTKEGDANTAICIVLPHASEKGTVANVRDFGALQDGTTNDATAIQAAIDSGRPMVYFPGSTTGAQYRIQSQLLVDNDNQWLVGDGDSSIIEMFADDTNMVAFSGTSTTNRIVGNGISKLWLRGRAYNSSPSNPPTGQAYGLAVYVRYCHRFTMQDCTISHSHGNQTYVIGSGDVTIDRNWFFAAYNPVDGVFSATSNADIILIDENENVSITNNHCHSNCKLHIYASGDYGNTVLIANNVSFPCNAEGVPLYPITGDANSYDSEGAVKHNISLFYGPDYAFGSQGRVIVANNLCSAATWSNLYYAANSDIDDDIGQRIAVTGNIFHAGSWHNRTSGSATVVGAVSFLGGREIQLSGNLILDAKCFPHNRPAINIYAQTQSQRINITGNIISNAFSGGIYLQNDAAHVHVADNLLYNCGARGLYPIHIAQTASLGSAKTISALDTGTDTFTSTAHGFLDGQRIRFAVSGGSFFAIDGVLTDEVKTFYIVNKATNTFQIAETPSGSALNIVSNYSGTLTATRMRYIGGHVIENNVILVHVEQKLSERTTFVAGDVSPTNDTITSADHQLANGDQILFSTDGTIFSITSPASLSTLYQVIDIDNDTFKIEPVGGGGALDITAAGSGTSYYRIYDRPTTYGGILVSITNQSDPTIIRNNTVISFQTYSGTYGANCYAILSTSPAEIITGNYIRGFLYGITLSYSRTDRAVESVQVAGNYLSKCYYPIGAAGTVSGLVLIDDSNCINAPSLWRVRTVSGLVSIQGSRRNGKVVAGHPGRATKSVTFTISSTTVSCTAHGYQDGERIQLTGTPPSPYATSTNYWVLWSTGTDGANALRLSATRGGSAITASDNGSANMVHQQPAYGTWELGDTLVNQDWASDADWVDAFCTTAGAVGTCAFTKRYMSTS